MISENNARAMILYVYGKVKLFDIGFTTGMVLGGDTNCVRAIVTGGQVPAALSLQGLAKRISSELAKVIPWDFTINKLGFTYSIKDERLVLELGFGDSLDAAIYSLRNGYIFELNGGFQMPLSKLPVIGSAFDAKSALTLERISFQYIDGLAGMQIKSVLIIGSVQYVFEIPEPENGTDSDSGSLVSAASGDIKWVSVNKDIKLIHIKRIGFSFQDAQIKLHLDIGFSISLFTLDFMDLYAGLSIGDGLAFSMGLKGLFISFNKPPVSVSGGLYMTSFNPPAFSGQAVVTVGNFSMGALGTYATLPDGKTSLFIYLMLSYPLGGPSFFFVTGLAMGIGLNRGMKMPRLDEVKNFPLVSAVLDPNNSSLKTNTDPATALTALGSSIYPSEGEFVIAAGVLFTTFELLKSFVLVSVSAGVKLEFKILGLSTLSIPKNAGKKLIFAELALSGVFSPDEGIINIDGQLTDQSYIFDTNCKLTGDFAFKAWTSGEHKGDFVVSIGGYHPGFQKPEHYPSVNRLGIHWKIDNKLSLEGNMYFALTPSCVMAGGAMALTYKSGKLSAWLKLSANFLLQWEPFHYDITANASIGASYGIFTLELDAAMHLYGPPFSGKITINWWVISFTISFGGSNQTTPHLIWTEFKKAFLPAGERVCSIRITQGLLNEIDENTWMACSQGLCFCVRSFFPSRAIVFGEDQSINTGNQNIGILPMDRKNLETTLSVTITRLKDMEPDSTGGSSLTADYRVDPSEYEIIPITENVPYAMWGQQCIYRPSAEVIKNVLTGAVIKTVEKTYTASSPIARDTYYRLDQLLDEEPINAFYAFERIPDISSAHYDAMKEKEIIQQTIDSSARKTMVSGLTEAGFVGLTEDRLFQFKDHIADLYDAPPKLANFI